MNNKKKNKANKKTAEKKGIIVKKQVPVYQSVLYLLPEDTTASELCGNLTIFPEEAIEVWPELNILELTVENRTITFESLKEDLEQEDLQLLEKLSMKQLYTCEYAKEDSELFKKVMQTFMEKFGGKLASDTEDFEPFLTLEEL